MSKHEMDKWLIDNTVNEQAAVEFEERRKATDAQLRKADAEMEELRKSLEKDGLL